MPRTLLALACGLGFGAVAGVIVGGILSTLLTSLFCCCPFAWVMVAYVIAAVICSSAVCGGSGGAVGATTGAMIGVRPGDLLLAGAVGAVVGGLPTQILNEWVLVEFLGPDLATKLLNNPNDPAPANWLRACWLVSGVIAGAAGAVGGAAVVSRRRPKRTDDWDD